MHELGVVFHIADQVMEIARDNGVSHIRKVTLQIGEVTAIIPYYLVDCWNWNAKRYDLLTDCTLEVETIPAVTTCNDCGCEYETVKYAKVCPKCGSENTVLKTGNEVIIKEILVDDEDTEEGSENPEDHPSV